MPPVTLCPFDGLSRPSNPFGAVLSLEETERSTCLFLHPYTPKEHGAHENAAQTDPRINRVCEALKLPFSERPFPMGTEASASMGCPSLSCSKGGGQAQRGDRHNSSSLCAPFSHRRDGRRIRGRGRERSQRGVTRGVRVPRGSSPDKVGHGRSSPRGLGERLLRDFYDF